MLTALGLSLSPDAEAPVLLASTITTLVFI
jgi:hypothetical protein